MFLFEDFLVQQWLHQVYLHFAKIYLQDIEFKLSSNQTNIATASSNTIFHVQFHLPDVSCSNAALYFVKALSLLTTWEGG